jgi:hypothetical protein
MIIGRGGMVIGRGGIGLIGDIGLIGGRGGGGRKTGGAGAKLVKAKRTPSVTRAVKRKRWRIAGAPGFGVGGVANNHCSQWIRDVRDTFRKNNQGRGSKARKILQIPINHHLAGGRHDMNGLVIVLVENGGIPVHERGC